MQTLTVYGTHRILSQSIKLLEQKMWNTKITLSNYLYLKHENQIIFSVSALSAGLSASLCLVMVVARVYRYSVQVKCTGVQVGVQVAPHVPGPALRLLQQHPPLARAQLQVWTACMTAVTAPGMDSWQWLWFVFLWLRSGTSQRARQINRKEASHNRINHKVSECEKRENASLVHKDKLGESST